MVSTFGSLAACLGNAALVRFGVEIGRSCDRLDPRNQSFASSSPVALPIRLGGGIDCMLVSNHVLAGAAIGAVARKRPALAFAAGLVSHLVLDSCPHWGTPLETPEDERRFLRVARCDGCCGLALMGAAAVTAGRGSRAAVVSAMAGSVLLDIDKPVRHFFGVEVFPARIQQFHEDIQKRVESPRRMPQEFVVGALGMLLAFGLLRART